MKQTSFIKNYKRKGLYKASSLLLCIAVVVGLIGIGFYSYSHTSNNAVVVKNLEQYNKALQDDSYIEISSDKIYDLKIDVVKTRSKLGIPLSKSVDAKIIAINLEPFTLPIQVPEKKYNEIMSNKKGHYIFKGNLVELSDDELKAVTQAIKYTNLEANKSVVYQPYYQYLDYKPPFNIALKYFVFAFLFFIFILFCYTQSMRKNSKALKSLKNFSIEDFETVCNKIDEELASPTAYKNHCITVTKNYIVSQNQQIIFALPTRELMWVYKQTIKKKMYGFIPAGTFNSIVFVFSDKNIYSVPYPKNDELMNELLNYISQNCKTCFAGYTEELEQLFKRDYDAFKLKWKLLKENSSNIIR